MTELLRIDGLRKSFGGIQAVAGCTLGFAPGKVTGLIGPNGAGKTTMVELRRPGEDGDGNGLTPAG